MVGDIEQAAELDSADSSPRTRRLSKPLVILSGFGLVALAGTYCLVPLDNEFGFLESIGATQLARDLPNLGMGGGAGTLSMDTYASSLPPQELAAKIQGVLKPEMGWVGSSDPRYPRFSKPGKPQQLLIYTDPYSFPQSAPKGTRSVVMVWRSPTIAEKIKHYFRGQK